MRTIALAILLCLSSAMVDAQTTEQCHSHKGAGDLIACYDGTVPSSTSAAPKRSKPAAARDTTVTSEPRMGGASATASKASTKQSPQFDVLEAENSKLDAKMKTLCRGC
jgi:hypothetical protein